MSATCAADAQGVYAAGDTARWPNTRTGRTGGIEHWTNAVEHARHVARNLLRGPADALPYDPLPFFWADQHGVKIQLLGAPGETDTVEILSGSADAQKFVTGYFQAGRLTGAAALKDPRGLALRRTQMLDSDPLASRSAQGAR